MVLLWLCIATMFMLEKIKIGSRDQMDGGLGGWP